MLHDLQQPNLNCSRCWKNAAEREKIDEERGDGKRPVRRQKPPCATAPCVASHLMDDSISAWIYLYNLASAYENETVQLYKLAGAKGADFELFAVLKAVHRKYEKQLAEQKASVPNVPIVKR